MSVSTLRAFTIEDALSINSFGCRAPIRLSADGRFLSYVVENRSGEAMQEQVWVTDIDAGETLQVLPEAVRSWGANWSPAGSVVAFVGDMGEGPQLWTYNAETQETRKVSSAILAFSPFLFSLPQWLPDGSAVVCAVASRVDAPGFDHLGKRISLKVAPEERLTENEVSVRCWESDAVRDRPNAAEASDSELLSFRSFGTLARFDICDGTLTPLVEDIQCDTWAVSPDGRYLAYFRLVGYEAISTICQLCVVATGGGEVRVLDPRVVESYAVSLSWSPDSTRIAYCPNHEVAVVGLDGANPRVAMPYEGGVIDEFYETPLWSPDGTFLLATRRASVWRIPLDGGEPLDLLPNRGTVGARGIAAPGGGPNLWSPDGRSTIVELRDWKSSEIGLARISLSGEGILDSEMSMHRLSDVPRYHMDISPARGLVTFVRQSATCPPDVWVTDGELSSSRRVTTLNPHVDESQFSTPQLLSWTGPDGAEHFSAYFPPVGAVEEPHPVIFIVYEGRQSGFFTTFGCQPVSNVQLFTNHGYGVCVPDQVFMSFGNQAEALRGMLACAVESLIAEGIADPARVGVFGHSFGGYITNVAITGMDCFAAAVCSTGCANYTSAYGAPSLSGDESCAQFVESAQPHMGVPPWENPQRYIENSPVFALDKVNTPVLIVHGDKDCWFSQAWEMFNGLRRLNKPAALAIYQGEDHAQCDWRRPNVIDFWERMFGWFDKYMGEER